MPSSRSRKLDSSEPIAQSVEDASNVAPTGAGEPHRGGGYSSPPEMRTADELSAFGDPPQFRHYHHNMPTGSAHDRIVNEVVNGEVVGQQLFPCRCTRGEDHLDDGSSWGDEGDPDDFHPESSFAGAEEIWLSSGMDEDYDFR